MRERLEQRLAELKAEYESGQKMLADLEARRAELKNTLLRISGAVLVLEELGKENARSEEELASLKEGLAYDDSADGVTEQ